MAPHWRAGAPVDASQSDASARSHASSDVFLFDADALSVDSEHKTLDERSGAHRRTQYSDQQLREMAARARAKVDWDALEQEIAFSDTSGWKARRRHASEGSAGDGRAAVSTLERAGGFAVAAVSTIPCSVAELRLVLRSRSREQFNSVMRCVYGDALLAGDLVHVVPPPPPPSRRFTSSTSVGSTASTESWTADEAELSIKAMRFDKTSFLATREDWCFLESIHPLDSSRMSYKTDSSGGRGGGSASSPPALGCTLVTLPWSSCRSVVDADTSKARRRRKVKEGERVVINYCFREDASGRATRVLFHGEFASSASHKSRDGAWKFVRSRLLFVAEQSSRFMLVARRRRLGMQVLVDPACVSTANPSCICCSRSFLLAKRRLCSICGFLVCDRCSRMQQREFLARGQPRTRTQIDHVRLCVRCVLRVDHCNFSNVTEDDLYPVAVVPDRRDSGRAGRARGPSDQPLANLLEQSLVNANTTRKESVLSVMKYLVEIEHDSAASSSADALSADATKPRAKASSFVPAELAPPPVEQGASAGGTEDRGQRELLDKIGWSGPLDDGTALEQCHVAHADARSYAIEVPSDPSAVLPAPRGPNEHKRVETIKRNRLDELGDVPELDIICSIAAKELECSTSMVTLVESDQFRVLASTQPAFSHQTFPREQGFCSHTVLSDRPLMVPNAPADVRFSAMAAVQQRGTAFYCGFPLVAADGTPIGSVCCVDSKPRRLTRAQYVTMKSLAVTASKVVQRAAAKQTLAEPAGVQVSDGSRS